MAASFPNIDPNIMSLLMQGSADGGGGPGVTHFIAGMGFDRFAQTIKKLHGLAGGDKTDSNVATGLTSQPATPMATAPRPQAPIAQAAPAPSGNPLLPLGRALMSMGLNSMPKPMTPAAINAIAAGPSSSELAAFLGADSMEGFKLGEPGFLTLIGGA